MAAGVIAEDRAWLERLDGELRGELAPVFAQASSRLTAVSYIGALLAEPGDRKSCWQLAERAGHATPRRMQALLAGYAWDWKAALAALQRFIVAQLGDPPASPQPGTTPASCPPPQTTTRPAPPASSVCEPLLPAPAWRAGKGGRPSRYCMRDVVNGIRYLDP